MPTYTFVTDKEGGTYIEQFKGGNIEEVVRTWHEKSHTIPGSYESYGMEVTAVSSVKNVWCIDGHDPAGHFYIVHIIATSEG